MFVAIINSRSYVKFTKKKRQIFWFSVGFLFPLGVFCHVSSSSSVVPQENRRKRRSSVRCPGMHVDSDWGWFSWGALRENAFPATCWRGWRLKAFPGAQWCPLNLGAGVKRFFNFHLDPWRNDPIWLAHIFQLGRFNHHLDFRYLLPGSLAVRPFSNDGS